MHLLDQLAEQKIADAIANGELSNLPGQGQPLPEDDCQFVPEELRVAYRIMKNANLLPAGLQVRKEINQIETLLAIAENDQQKMQLHRKMQFLLMKLDSSTTHSLLLNEAYYRDRIAHRK